MLHKKGTTSTETLRLRVISSKRPTRSIGTFCRIVLTILVMQHTSMRWPVRMRIMGVCILMFVSLTIIGSTTFWRSSQCILSTAPHLEKKATCHKCKLIITARTFSQMSNYRTSCFKNTAKVWATLGTKDARNILIVAASDLRQYM